MSPTLYQNYLFFKKHGAGWVGHAAQQALRLARAERWAYNTEVDFLWEEEDSYDEDMLGDHASWCSQEQRERADAKMPGRRKAHHTHEVRWCAAQYRGRTLASLGAIIDPDRAYKRVIEAELALEAMTEITRTQTYY